MTDGASICNMALLDACAHVVESYEFSVAIQARLDGAKVRQSLWHSMHSMTLQHRVCGSLTKEWTIQIAKLIDPRPKSDGLN